MPANIQSECLDPSDAIPSATDIAAQPGRFQLFSMGEDGIPNTEDDIKSW